jgi:GH24 family phage-related lysozyme (muramidase)
VLAPLVGKAVPDDPYPDVPDGEQPQRFTFSDKGCAFLERREMFVPGLYNDSAGHCTIGIGHLVHYGRTNGTDPSEAPFKNGITHEEGYRLLKTDLVRFENAVRDSVETRLNQ